MQLGIDIGGTKVVVAIGTAEGEILAQRRLPMPGGPAQEALTAWIALTRDLLSEVKHTHIDAIGISAPAPLDREAGLMRASPNLPEWDAVPIVQTLGDAFSAPAALENDANALALAEWQWGAARGASNVVALTMSTGIGAGVIADGQLLHGRAALAGELGHVPIVWDGDPCACGQRGCFEAYAGGASWIRRLGEITPADSLVASLAGGVAHARPEHVFAADAQGDRFASEEIDRFIAYLAHGVVMTVFAFDPEIIVLGTIVAAAGDRVLIPLREAVWPRVWPAHRDTLRLEAATLGRDGPAHAGLAVARHAMRDSHRSRPTGRATKQTSRP